MRFVLVGEIMSEVKSGLKKSETHSWRVGVDRYVCISQTSSKSWGIQFKRWLGKATEQSLVRAFLIFNKNNHQHLTRIWSCACQTATRLFWYWFISTSCSRPVPCGCLQQMQTGTRHVGLPLTGDTFCEISQCVILGGNFREDEEILSQLTKC